MDHIRPIRTQIVNASEGDKIGEGKFNLAYSLQVPHKTALRDSEVLWGKRNFKFLFMNSNFSAEVEISLMGSFGRRWFCCCSCCSVS